MHEYVPPPETTVVQISLGGSGKGNGGGVSVMWMVEPGSAVPVNTV